MNTNQLKRFAQAARIRLLEDVKNRFLYWGIDQDGNVNYSVETTTGGYVFRGGVYNDESVPKKWDNLLNAVKHHTPNDTIEEASINQEPHRIPFYLQALSSKFHSLWNYGKQNTNLRFINSKDKHLTFARLGMIYSLKIILSNGLNILGVKPLEVMK